MSTSQTPKRQHLAAYEVLPVMTREAEYYLVRSVGPVSVLAVTGGIFVMLGALFSLLLSDGTSALGSRLFMWVLGLTLVSLLPSVPVTNR